MFMAEHEKWLIYGLMILTTSITVVPFIWMITTSFKIQAESTASPPILLPVNPGFQAYGKVLHEIPFGSLYFNSIVSTLVVVISQILIVAMAAYGSSRLRFKRRDVLFVLYISILMMSSQIFLIPQFLTVKEIGLLNSIPGLVLPGLFNTYNAFLLRQFLPSVLKELEGAATMDGYNHLTIFFRTMLPLIKPGLIVCVIINGLWSWNNLMWPLVINTSMDRMTLPAGLALFFGRSGVEYPVLMAGTLLTIISISLLYIFFQRYFIRGIASTGIKGRGAVLCQVLNYGQ